MLLCVLWQSRNCVHACCWSLTTSLNQISSRCAHPIDWQMPCVVSVLSSFATFRRCASFLEPQQPHVQWLLPGQHLFPEVMNLAAA